MKDFSFAIFLSVATLLSGCASQSSKTIANLDNTNPLFKSGQCENAREYAWIHDEAQKNKLWMGPSFILLAGPVAVLPVFVSSVGLNTADRMQANDIAKRCGGTPKSKEQVTADIALDASLSLAVGAVIPVTLPSKVSAP